MTLPALGQSANLVLLITGEAKRAVVEKAMADPHLYPIGALLMHQGLPLRILWAA